MGRVAVLASCALNQLALDFQGNVDRIIEAIGKAKDAGTTYLCTPEMSLTGYGCGDHYHERDTEMHAWEALATVMEHPIAKDIMVDVGLPVMHKNVIYNCKLVFLNKKVLFVRPKMILANDGVMGYRETRWFTAWAKVREVEEYSLPSVIKDILGQRSVPFGDAMIQTNDTTVGYEICEELFNPESCHLSQYLDGAEIIANGLGSMEEYGRPGICYQLVQTATMKSGGCYLYANQRGCDGTRGYYPGDTCIGLNGSIVAHTTLHTLDEVDVITAAVDLECIRQYKASIRSRCIHASKTKAYPRVQADFSLTCGNWWESGIPACDPIEPFIPTKEEQILKVPACWLWDYLRRSGRNGLLLPLFGDIDSSVTATIVFSMCHLVVEAVAKGNQTVLVDVRRLVGKSDYVPGNAKELCGHLVQTLYLELSSSSSTIKGSKETVQEISNEIGSTHVSVDIPNVLPTTVKSLESHSSTLPEQLEEKESERRTFALQNLRSRLAMMAAYFFAESGMVSKHGIKDFIVLASSSADKHLHGADTKYGKRYGDINLIEHYAEEDLVKYLHLAKERLRMPVLQKLIPNTPGDENTTLHYLNAVEGCGPYSMFGRLWNMQKDCKTASEVAEKVKEFYRNFSLRRQNTLGLSTTFYMPFLGPPDDSRPILYPTDWNWQFKAIDKTAKDIIEHQLDTEL